MTGLDCTSDGAQELSVLATLSKIIRAKETGLVAVILLLALLLTVFGGTVRRRIPDPNDPSRTTQVEVNKFLQRANIDQNLKNCSWIAIMAVGVTVVIIAGGIDLSIGASYCLAAVAGALVLRGAWIDTTPSPGWFVPAGILVCLLVGTLCGLANGAMVTMLRVHPFIITLGTMSIFRGIAFVSTTGQSVTDFPPWFGDTVRATLGEFTIAPLIVMLLVVVAGEVYLRHMAAGREVYAVGGNELAARFSGVRVSRIKLTVFTIGGFSAGVAAVVTLGIFGSADSSTGRGYELDVIAAAVVGGASLSGGRGTALGALLGALVIQLIANGIVILKIDQAYTEIIKGAVIILAVVLDRFSASLSERRLTGAAGRAPTS
jgi:ribose transport system permease protein